MPRITHKLNHELFRDVSPKEANFILEYTTDFDHRRAAEACGYDPNYGITLVRKKEVEEVLQEILTKRLEQSDITAEWLLMELVDNALISKQKGKYSASNTALGMIGKHQHVDAFAADKVKVEGHDEVVERLRRARVRLNGVNDVEVSFL